MARTTADVLADRLIDWGVSVFGLPGDGINGITSRPVYLA